MAQTAVGDRAPDERINKVKSIPFIIIHLLPLLAIFTGVSWVDVALLVVLYYTRVFFITGFYHRYFSHKSYKMGRVSTFVAALLGTTTVQKGPLWWGAHHRHHHRFSDTEFDVHSPIKGFWWSHVGWILCDKYKATDYGAIKDFAKYPELRWVNKYHWVAPVALGVLVYLVFGASGLVVGFFGSTVLLFHGTFFINSLAHVFGRRRFVTDDTSRNSMTLALITAGEGWHNNHHYMAWTVKSGFRWWEYDPTYWTIKAMSWVGITKKLRMPREDLLERNRLKDGNFDVGTFRVHFQKAGDALVHAQRSVGEAYTGKKVQLSSMMDNALVAAEDLSRLSRTGKPAAHAGAASSD